jgi:hypothetical protein
MMFATHATLSMYYCSGKISLDFHPCSRLQPSLVCNFWPSCMLSPPKRLFYRVIIWRETVTRSVRCGSPAAVPEHLGWPRPKRRPGRAPEAPRHISESDGYRPPPSDSRAARCARRSSPVVAELVGKPRRGRPRCRSTEDRDKLPSPHSITSSARPRQRAVIPSFCAVLRLMIRPALPAGRRLLCPLGCVATQA